MPGQPFRDVVEIEEHLIADPYDGHLVPLGPILHRPYMKSKIPCKCAQRDQPLSRDLDNIVVRQSVTPDIRHYAYLCRCS